MSFERHHPPEQNEQYDTPTLHNLKKFVFDSFKFSQGNPMLQQKLIKVFTKEYPEMASAFQELLHSDTEDFWRETIEEVGEYAIAAVHRDNLIKNSSNVIEVALRDVTKARGLLEGAEVEIDEEFLFPGPEAESLHRLGALMIKRDHNFLVKNARMNREALNGPLAQERSSSFFLQYGIIGTSQNRRAPNMPALVTRIGAAFADYIKNFNEDEVSRLDPLLLIELKVALENIQEVIDVHVADNPEHADAFVDLFEDATKAYRVINDIMPDRR